MKTIFLGMFLLLMSCTKQVKKGDLITVDNAELITTYDKSDIESLVTYYFASRIRKDNKWREALPDSTTWSVRMQDSIKDHNTWTFLEFKNIGLYNAEYGTYVKVYFKLKDKKGNVNSGEDDIELSKINNMWVISKVPA